MNIKLFPPELSGTVKAIPSKSLAHRALICAALADSPTVIACDGTSRDIEATSDCLSQLKEDAPVFRCGESGSTFRFLLPIAGALGLNAAFHLEGRLPERPLTPLYEELIRHGCQLSAQRSNPFCISGQLTPGVYTLDAGVSSQFISGLLMALPLLSGGSELRLSGKPESAPYINLTMNMLEKFGIEIGSHDGYYTVKGSQTYHSPGNIQIEGDWSNAAFWLCAGAISENPLTCTGLNLQSNQGDRAILAVLERFGAKVTCAGDSVTVSAGNLRGTEIDARDIPDLVPVLSVVAAAATGKTVIRNAGRLRIKESDRLSAVTDILTELGADITQKEDGLAIRGGVALKGGTVSSRNDHRIAMSAAIAAVLCEKPVVIQGAEAVNKSYPGFFDDYKTLGGFIQS
ncbi:MAG: 3-phosphoshikimate 1-carboxyvinyltransferase [Oscillospiraceae bacterium]|nr:3-phosphoshikimate 1-carboxyvinyltransferase [Oscillospiraceae bacterium]